MQKHSTIEEVADQVQTREDFEYFLRLLLEDYHQHADVWENVDLPQFLTGLYGFTSDLAGYDQRVQGSTEGEASPWRLFATMLLAARVYE